jgi:hypothetical protein
MIAGCHDGQSAKLKDQQMKINMTRPVFVSRLLAGLVLGACVFAFTGIQSVEAADKAAPKKPGKTVSVKVDDLTLNVPTTWKKTPPANRLRKGQFNLPAAKGEKDPVEMVIYEFGGGGGGVGANVRRWIGQFQAKGRVAKVLKGTSPQGPYIVVDITGTYNMPVGPPINRKTKALANARMLAVILAVKEKRKVYYLKAAGSMKTVNSHAAAIRASYGGDPKKEEKLPLPGN